MGTKPPPATFTQRIPSGADFGLKSVMLRPQDALIARSGGDGCDYNPVVELTVRGPRVAAGSMFRTAIALVPEFTVSETTVIPAPKFATVVPWTKWVMSRYCHRVC